VCRVWSLSVPRARHSFPTRRSSDLRERGVSGQAEARADAERKGSRGAYLVWIDAGWDDADLGGRHAGGHERGLDSRGDRHDVVRSEEHTSELQSRENLVCRLLLEKK